MPDREQLIQRLEALGRAEPPQLTHERLTSIEARAAESITLVRPSVDDDSLRSKAIPLLLAVAALLLLFVGALAWFDGGSALTVAAADGTVVIEMPDGRRIDATVGADVPDGSLIDVAEGSSVTLGDDELGPGRYEVRDGRPFVVGPAPPDETSVPPVAGSTSTTTAPVRANGTDDDPGIDTDRSVDETTTSIVGPRPGTTVPTDRAVVPTTSLGDRSTTTVVRRTTTTTADRRGETATTAPGDRSTSTTAVTRTTTTTTTTTLITDGRRDGIGE